MIYTVKQFASMIQRSPNTLRNWDKSGVFKPSCIGTNGYRYYDDTQLIEFRKATQTKLLGVLLDTDTEDAKNTKAYLLNTGKPYKLIHTSNCSNNIILKLIENLQHGDISKVIFYSDNKFKNDIPDFKKLLESVALSFKAGIGYIVTD